MRFRIALVFLLITIIGFLACQHFIMADDGSRNMSLIIDAPIPSLAPVDSVLTFQAKDGFDYEFENGTKISIPQSALTNINGEIVIGKVTLHIRFLKNAFDFFQYGILLTKDQQMVKTSGGIEIWAEQNDERLFIDPTQNVQIKLATYGRENGYSLFKLSENKLRWDSLLNVTPVINKKFVALEKQLKKSKPRIKFPMGDQHFALNYNGIVDAIYNKKRTNINHHLTQKKMKNYGLRWADIQVDSIVQFNGKKELADQMVWKNISRKRIPSWTENLSASLEKIKGNRYRLVVEDTLNSKKFSTHVEAIMPLKELFSLGPGFWKKDYETKTRKTKSLAMQIAHQPDSYRQFSISDFGIYSWQMENKDEPIVISAFFRENKSPSSTTIFKQVIYLSGDRKGLIYYPHSKKGQFLLYADRHAKVFSICPDGRFFTFPEEDMSLMEFEQLKKMKEPSFIFKLEELNPIELQKSNSNWLSEP